MSLVSEISQLATRIGSEVKGKVSSMDSRLSDARTPVDGSVTYAKLSGDLTSRQAIPGTNEIDWSSGGVFTKALSFNTSFTFSNLRLNKVITLVLSGNVTIGLPTYCKKMKGSGEYAATGVNYLQLHCTNASSGSEEVWFSITEQMV